MGRSKTPYRSFGIACAFVLLWTAPRWPSERQRSSAEAEAHANRGIALLEQFRFKEAAAEFEALVALRPESVSAWVNLGIAYFNQRDFDRALEALGKARRVDPSYLRVHYNLGLVYKLAGRTEDAVAAFERVLEQDPNDSMTHYYLGTLYANLRRLDEAASHLRQAIALQPGNESAHFSLGNVLIRQGKVEEGRKELDRFRRLKERFPAEAASAGLQYTEMGKYAEAIEEEAPARQVRSAEEVLESGLRFMDRTKWAGLELPPLPPPPPLPESVATTDYGPSFIEERVLPYWGMAVAFRDLDGDDDPDLIVLRGGVPLVLLNEGGRFRRSEQAGLPANGKFVGLTLGDVDNDFDPDVYLAGAGPNALFLNDGHGRFQRASGQDTAGSDVSVAASFVDIDHDGDLDIYVANYLDPAPPESWRREAKETLRVPYDLPGAPNRLYRNNTNGSFSEIARASRTDGGAARSLGALFSDFDGDRDIDALVVNDGGPIQVFSNDRVGTFTESARLWGMEMEGRLRGVDSGDYDQDGRFDLFLTAEGAALNRLLRHGRDDTFSPDLVSPYLLSAGVPGSRFGLAFADVDNDSDLDVILVVNEAEVLAAVYQNTREGFRRAAELKAAEGGLEEGRSLAVADIDNDGKLDVAVGTDRGRLVVFRNESEAKGGWIRVRAKGLSSNRDGLGTKVEVRAGRARQRREVRAASGFLSQNDLPLHFGLGTRSSADYIRFLWPGGVKQIEMDVSGARTVTIEELNRKGTSCPILYAWDGRRMRFVTDFLGGSAIGNLLAPGRYNTPDTEEVVKLEQFPLRQRAGRYELRWVNQLEEVMMYDKAALIVVDHRGDLEVFPNERLMPAPPYPEPRLYAVQRLRTPLRAVDHGGRDVTELIERVDRRTPDGFELLPFKGYAQQHALTLELGPIGKEEHVVLLLYGFVDYADSSSNLAASQAGVACLPPYLEVGDESGRFERALPQMGFPAGLPKTMLVDLQGLVGPRRHLVRITTNMRLYWDRIQLATVAPDAELVVRELGPERAELRFLGYPAPYRPDGRAPSLYDYGRIVKEALWDAHTGDYTRYGDVKELVDQVDDCYVIAGHGDELALSFDAGGLPSLPAGWKRSFLVYADGFGKDMDLSSARPDTVLPLPFHRMSAYPYPPTEHYPDTPAHRRYRQLYNTRHIEQGRLWSTRQP